MTRTTRATLVGLLATLALTACGPLNGASPPRPADPSSRTINVDLSAGWNAGARRPAVEGRVVGLGSRNAALHIGRLDLYDMTDPGQNVNHPYNNAPPLPILGDKVSTYGPNRYGINYDDGGERGWRFPIEINRAPGHVYQVYVQVSTVATLAGDDVACRIWESGAGQFDEQATEFLGQPSLHRTITVICHAQIIT